MKYKKEFINFIENLVNYAPTDYDEGLGTTYERYVLNKYLKNLKRERRIKSIFEGPSDGTVGIRGINSLPFADNHYNITYYSPSKRELECVKKSWKKMNKNLNLKSGKTHDLPFADNSFDLVWNFCIVEHFKNPVPLIREMTRISRRYVLIITQNKYNYGTFFHIIYHKLIKKKWNHGLFKWMTFKGIEQLVNRNNLKVLERGCIDAPIWPDTWDMPIRGLFKKFLIIFGKSWKWGSLKKNKRPSTLLLLCEKIEKLPLLFIKMLIAHHLYILCEKVYR